MFGMDKRTLLKKDIIELLDQTDQPISVKNIQRTLGYSNVTTISEVCKELQLQINSVYTKEEFSLTLSHVNSGFIQLQRHSTNFQSLYESIFSQDLAYDILIDLIRYRNLSTVDFSLSHNISKSTLQRRIKRINEEISIFKVRIACSNRIYFDSREIMVRIFSYIFLWSTHRQFSNISWNVNTYYYRELTSKVFQYLKIPFDYVQEELLSFWIYIISNAISKKMELSLTDQENEILQSFEIPDKPDFLKRWPTVEWQMLVITIFNSDLYEFDLLLKKDSQSFFSKSMNQDILDWKTHFSKYFGELSTEGYKFIEAKITKYYLSFFFSENDFSEGLVEDMNHIVTLDTFKKHNPLYWSTFERFWQNLNINLKSKDANSQKKLAALLLCVNLYPIEKLKAKIYIYVSTDISLLFADYLKQIIFSHYKDKYDLVFVQDFTAAQLILCTAPFDRKLINNNQHYLVLRSHMMDNDFGILDQILSNISTFESNKCSDRGYIK